MTVGLYFSTEHAMLWHVRYALSNYPSGPDKPTDAYLAAGSACVLACQAALEALINGLLQRYGRLRHWDELKLKSKIETIADVGGLTVDWGKQPWQDLTRLIYVRNWLTHSKENYVGLVGAEGEWIADGVNKIPKFNPKEELLEESIRRFYNAVRNAGILLSTGLGYKADYTFLVTERYEPLMVG